MPENFKIELPCKAYVKQFLVNSFGEPVKFPHGHIYLRRLREFLDKSELKENKWEHRFYTENLNIIISEDDFIRYGWNISLEDSIKYFAPIEEDLKIDMRLCVGLLVSFGYKTKKAIEVYQEKNNLSENTWSYESIKKDFYRNGQIERDLLLNAVNKYMDAYFKPINDINNDGIEYHI